MRLSQFLLLTMLPALAAPAFAQDPLRWKLAEGDVLNLKVEQATTSDVSFSGKQAATQIDLAIELTWTVLGVKEQKTRIKQTIDRLQLKMTPAKGSPVVYDSGDEQRRSGAAKGIEAAIQPLVGSSIELTMSGRGEISDAKPLTSEEESPAAGQAAASGGVASLSRSTVQQLLQQSLVLLPENAVAEGDTWTSEKGISSSVGALQQQTTYKLAGTDQQDGRELTRIESTTKLTPAGPLAAAKTGGKAPAKPKLKSHEQSSVILFDRAAGRVAQAESTQELVTEQPFRETTIVVKLVSKQKTIVSAQ